MAGYQGRFIDTDRGRLYLACFGDPGANRALLYLPPFAEEMNLSRAVVARLARRLADRGWRVVLLDYRGTGDSEGELDQCRLSDWLGDVDAALAWIQTERQRPVSLWGLRFGCLLGAHYLATRSDFSPAHWLLWQPCADGRRMMKEFFRLKQVSEAFAGGAGRTDWLGRCLAGEPVEVAGYPLAPALTQELCELRWPASAGGVTPRLWLQQDSPRPSATRNGLADLLGLRPESLAGQAFWQVPDLYDQPAWIERSLDWLEAGR